MKKIIVFILCIIIGNNYVLAQQNPATQLAEKIAKKMKDSLSLTGNQKNQVYDINMLLHNQKMAARQQYTDRDSVRFYLQRIEGKRDSLYKTILPDNKFQMYREKKRNLVNNN